MKKEKPILWGWNKPEKLNVRSKKHQNYLIKEYNKTNKNKVSNMQELITALKNEKTH